VYLERAVVLSIIGMPAANRPAKHALACREDGYASGKPASRCERARRVGEAGRPPRGAAVRR
jgi:hypothetical protein